MKQMFDASDIDGDGKVSESEIRDCLEGNICRCTGYQNIVKAVAMGRDNMVG